MASFGVLVAGTLKTGRVTIPGGGVVSLGAAANFRAVYLYALAGNAADDIEYSEPGFTAGTGMPLPKGVWKPVLVDSLAAIELRGTAGGVVAWEGYR